MDKLEVKHQARRILDPVVGVLAATGVPPLLVTVSGTVLSLYGAIVVARGSLALGAVFLMLSGLCDVLDGDLARRRGMVSRFGAFLDSTLDRVAEFAYFGGILYYVVDRPGVHSDFVFAVTMIALTGSVLTSYARARAEGLGYECKVGVLERPERIVALTLGLLLGYRVLVVVLVFLAAATVYTSIQRILHVYRVASADGRPFGQDAPAPAERNSGAPDSVESKRAADE